MFQSKRPVFDSKAKAVPDEAKALAGAPVRKPKARAGAASAGGGGGGGSGGGGGGGGGWEAKSSQLREAMRAAREYSQAVKSGGPLPPMAPSSGPDPSLVPCPNCGRSFNANAADRHIPLCASIKARVSLGAAARALARRAGVMAPAPPRRRLTARYSLPSPPLRPLRATRPQPTALHRGAGVAAGAGGAAKMASATGSARPGTLRRGGDY